MDTLNEVIENVKRRQRIEREHAFMYRLLRDIEELLDRSSKDSFPLDAQQICVGIKQYRNLHGTEAIMNPNIKPGLVRE